MNLINKRRDSIWQFVKFNLVGVLNTFVDVMVFVALTGLGVCYLAAQVISYGCGTGNSYFLNKRWTFGRKDRTNTGMLAKFLAVNLLVLAISAGLLHFMISTWQMSEWISKLIVTFVTMMINFAGNRMWVFRTRRDH